jgi:mono/diheme cytochrome c family protein
MKTRRAKTLTVLAIVVLTSGLVLAGLALAADDTFKFMPKGGRELLLEVKAKCANCDDLVTLVTTKRSADDWQKYFAGKQSTVTGLSDAEKRKGALASFTEKQIKTLASYLSINLPMAKDKLPQDPARAQWETVLPADGRKLTLDKCMGCHSLATTVLISGDLNGWGVIMRKSDHVNLGMNEQQLQTLLHYLTINMPVPESEIPDEFKKGTGGY